MPYQSDAIWCTWETCTWSVCDQTNESSTVIIGLDAEGPSADPFMARVAIYAVELDHHRDDEPYG